MYRQLALFEESGGSSEYSTGSTLLSHALGDKTEQSQVKPCARDQETQSGLENSQIGDQTGVQDLENGIFCDLSFPRGTKNFVLHSDCSIAMLNCFILIKMMTLITADTPPVCDDMRDNHGSETTECEYPSPLQVTPQFRSLAAAIPSPKFSESVSNHYFIVRLIYIKMM